MTSFADIKFFVLADFIIRGGRWLPKRIAFAKRNDSKPTFVIKSRVESRGPFSVTDMQVNVALHSSDAILDNPALGMEVEVEEKDWANYLRGPIYEIILKNSNKYNYKIGTYCLATYMYLQPLFQDKIVYMEKYRNVEEELIKHAGK